MLKREMNNGLELFKYNQLSVNQDDFQVSFDSWKGQILNLEIKSISITTTEEAKHFRININSKLQCQSR